ncbi:MAG: anti-sigma factor family protein [Candidatus Binatia bacterium]
MPEQTRTLISPCGDFEENLVLFHYGDLDGAERGALQAHLQTCALCGSYLKELDTLLPLTLEADLPPETFWTDYNRELRQKLDRAAEQKSWMQTLGDFFQPRWMPALATAGVVALALTFTVGRGIWSTNDPAQENAAIMELLPVAENLEFFKAMEMLDNLDLLESMGNQSNAA